ncbi:hypothetical protein GCM10027566_35950 [Arachidicoccus ginsenosidivorans]
MIRYEPYITNRWLKSPIVIILIIVMASFWGCATGNKKGPNIRKVKLEINVDHFERDFFGLDTNKLEQGLDSLKTKYGYFYNDFLYNIAAFSMDDGELKGQINAFLRSNKEVYDSVDYYIPHLNRQIKEIENAFKRAKIYFPGLDLPTKVITYIGPIDGYGSFVSKSGLCIGLQQFFGSKFSGYIKQADYLESLFGKQRLQQFAPDYIAPNAIMSWINREFPDKAGHFTLGEKLAEEGRKVYLLKALLPDLTDSAIFGYSESQTKWCHNNSIIIKRYFEQKSLLQTKNPEKIVAYLSDNLRPSDLPKEFPDNIGKYLGFIMVQDFMDDHKNTTLPVLMELDFGKIRLK